MAQRIGSPHDVSGCLGIWLKVVWRAKADVLLGNRYQAEARRFLRSDYCRRMTMLTLDAMGRDGSQAGPWLAELRARLPRVRRVRENVLD